MVSNARQILDATPANQYDAMFLKVVTFTGNVAGNFHAVGEPHATHLAKRRIGLLRCGGVHARADAALLGTSAQCRRRGLHFELRHVRCELAAELWAWQNERLLPRISGEREGSRQRSAVKHNIDECGARQPNPGWFYVQLFCLYLRRVRLRGARPPRPSCPAKHHCLGGDFGTKPVWRALDHGKPSGFALRQAERIASMSRGSHFLPNSPG